MMIRLRCGLHTIFLMALIMGLPWFQVAWADLNEGLVAYYPFNGNANDASSNGNHGTVHGATLTEDQSGIAGSAYSFDGNDDFIQAEVDINPDVMPQATLVAWVKADDGSPTKQIISHDDAPFDRSLGLDNRGGGTGWSAFSGSGGVLGYSPVTVGEWFFVAVVYDQDAGTVKLYVNDVKYKEDGTLGTGWKYIRIGSNPSYGEYFEGIIDEVRIYNRALSECEVLSLYTGKDECDGVCIAPLGVDGANSCYQYKTQAWCTANGGTWHLGKSCSDFLAPLLVELSGFTAVPTKNGVALNWDTGAEPDSQAFHIWRGTPDLGSYCGCSRNLEDYKKISMLDKKGKPILIPTTGDERMGAKYSHLDKEAKPGIAYCYILEDINPKGESEFYFEYIVFTSE